ncbi:glycosyltransferase [Alloscardovia criceti]|uniref:glycosyltransferase n=1 Tax=Alloscardovia criceti TaxID=356828 RepID=UPI000527B7F6|nr:glycosyltransferase [Alloscardovia criceti]
MRRLRIALVVDTLGKGGNGTSNSAAQFAHELERLGHEVRLVGVDAPDKRYRAREQYIPVVTHFAKPHQLAFAHADTELFKTAFADVDLVHIYMPFSFGRAALKYCKAHNIPVTAGFHVQPENIVANAPFLGAIAHIIHHIYRWMWKGFYEDIEHIHVPTHMEERLLLINGFTQHLHVFSNGYDDEAFTMRESEPPLHKGKIVVASSGRLSSEKAQHTLIRAISLSKYKDDIELRLAGSGPLEKRLRLYAMMRLGWGKFFIGFIPHELMPNFLKKAHLLVHASQADIEGISVIEAMAVGVVPIIASSELSAAGDFALVEESLFPVGDARTLARKIDWWIEHADERKQWGRRYALHTQAHYSISSSVQAFLRMAQEAINAKNASEKA